MKYLLLLLFTFSAHAQFKLEITMSDSKYAKREIIQDTKELVINRFVYIENKLKIAKGEWKESPVSEISKTVVLGEESKTLYYHPTNFTITITDISQEIADKEAEKAAAKAERQELRGMKQDINNSNLPPKIKKLLRYLIKEIRE